MTATRFRSSRRFCIASNSTSSRGGSRDEVTPRVAAGGSRGAPKPAFAIAQPVRGVFWVGGDRLRVVARALRPRRGGWKRRGHDQQRRRESRGHPGLGKLRTHLPLLRKAAVPAEASPASAVPDRRASLLQDVALARGDSSRAQPGWGRACSVCTSISMGVVASKRRRM